MDSWETSGKSGIPPVVRNQWEGEDEEDEVLDSWDMEEPEDKPAPVEIKESDAPASAGSKKKKKDVKPMAQPTEPAKDMTPEEKLAEKLLRQKLQEESDLVLAKEIFGVSSNGALESKEDYEHFQSEILARIAPCEKNADYLQFTEQLTQALCLHLNASDLKRVHNIVGNLHIEKLKIEKGDKGKKSKSKNKAKLRMDEETDYNEYSAYTTDDFDDFI